jgi:hypothetical protein
MGCGSQAIWIQKTEEFYADYPPPALAGYGVASSDYTDETRCQIVAQNGRRGPDKTAQLSPSEKSA